MDLTHCWLRLQNQIYILSEINIVNERMMHYADEVEQWEDVAFTMLGDIIIETDEQRLINGDSSKIISVADTITVIPYSTKLKVNLKKLFVG